MKQYLIAVTLLMTSAPLATVCAQPGRPLHDEIVGTWRLIASRQRLADGTQRADPQTGAHGVGYIMYDATGHVCVVIANPDRPAWRAPTSPSDSEVRSAFQGMVAYCGTFATNEQERSVVHHIEADREPSVMGTDRRRLVTLVGNRLVLRPTPLPAGVQEWTVEWERVGSRTP